MSDRHDAHYNSPTKHRNSSNNEDCELERDFFSPITTPMSSFVRSSTGQASFPSQTRNQYTNKETVKVNLGLAFSNIPTNESHRDEHFYSSIQSPPIDFGAFIIPIVAPEQKPTTEQLVRRLLEPPSHAFVHGVLSLQWVFGVLGMEQVRYREDDERYVLVEASNLRTRGVDLGLPVALMEWLCGNDESSSATDQGLLLTPDFFEQHLKEQEEDGDT